MDDLGGVSRDDESDAYTRQDGRGATVGAKVSGEARNDADMIVEDPSDAAIDGEHMDVVGHPDENEGPNEKEDPSDVGIDGEHMDTIGSPDETEEPNAQEPISHVLNTPVDNCDVLMTDAPDTINLADPPSHESEITSPCDSEKKGDGLDGAKANQEDVPASQNTVKVEVSSAQKSLNPSLDFIIDKYQKKKVVRKPKRATSMAYIRRSKRHKQGMLSKADNGEVVNEPQLPDLHERNKKKGTLLQDFLPVIGKDRKEIKLEPWTEDLTRDSKVTKTRMHVSKEVLDFFNQVQKPGYRFPWGTGFTVDDKFWQCLVAKDANRKGWLNDSVIELSIQFLLYQNIALATMHRSRSSANFKAYDSILQSCILAKIKPNPLASPKPRSIHHVP
ncbi:hypothetical protein Tco_0539300 [Tanacetum coccineum]